MKHLLLVTLLFLPFQLFGFDFNAVSADYDVTYGVIGKVGKSHAEIEISEGTYKIKVSAEGTGLAKFFSRGREESYESTGIISEGKLLPTLFVKNRIWGEKEERKRYFFDHDKKSVSVIKTSINGGKVSESRETLPYYAVDDILTLFFNLKYLIGDDLAPLNKKELVAVGANSKNGDVSVEAPKEALKKEMKKLLKKEDHLLVVILNQKLFSSKNGEMYVNINDAGLCDSVVLKDVVLYGDLVGKIKNLKIEK